MSMIPGDKTSDRGKRTPVGSPWYGAITGAVLYAGFFIFSLATHLEFSVMGVSAPELREVAEKYLMWPFISYQLKILLVYLVLGAVVGAFFSFPARAIVWAVGKGRSRVLFVSVLLMLAVVFHWLVYARDMALHPQVYTEFMYDKGGFFAWVQVLVTDRLGPWVPTAVLGLLLLFGLVSAVWLLRQEWSRRQIKAAAIVTAVLAVALVSVLGIRSLPAPDRNAGPNLLILSADSLRPDRLSINGYDKELTPAIDRLAREGVRFNNAYSQLPRTFPAWVTLLTGRYPFHHGITSMFPSVEDRQKDFRALPKILSEHGYETVVVSDYAGDIFPRIDLGFDEVHAPTFNMDTLAKVRGLEIHTHLLPYVSNRAGRVVLPELLEFVGLSDPSFVMKDTISRLRKLRGEERFMLCVFMSCSHFPYSPPWPYYKEYGLPGYDGPYKYRKTNLINVDEEVSEEDIRQINAIFDASVRATDEAFGGILDELERLGMAEDTVVVVLSDHGENLYEGEGLMGHGDHLRYPYSLRFPLIIKDPRSNSGEREIGSRTRAVDLFPTLLELLGIDVPAETGQGLPPGMGPHSLVQMIRGEDKAKDLPVYAETGLWFIDKGPGFFQKKRIKYPDVTSTCFFEPYYDNEIVLKDKWKELTEIAKHRMLIDDGWKVIYCPTPDGIEWELYDLSSDPDELINLAETEDEKLAEMKLKLFDFMETRPGWTMVGDYFVPEGERP